MCPDACGWSLSGRMWRCAGGTAVLTSHLPAGPGRNPLTAPPHSATGEARDMFWCAQQRHLGVWHGIQRAGHDLLCRWHVAAGTSIEIVIVEQKTVAGGTKFCFWAAWSTPRPHSWSLRIQQTQIQDSVPGVVFLKIPTSFLWICS